MRKVYVTKLRLHKESTQGSVFEGGFADGYPNKGWGIIITARCDMAHEGKVNVVHYLPIVDIEDWLKIDGKMYMWKNARLSRYSKLVELCKSNGFPYIGVSLENFEKMGQTIENEAVKKKYQNIVANYFEIMNVTFEEFKPSDDSIRSCVHNLMENKLADFHLLESWEVSTEQKYKVVLLRDLNKMEYSMASHLVGGVLESEINNKDRNDLYYTDCTDSIFGIVAELDSPYLEHLMQRFTLNFYRVGVEDFPIMSQEIINEKIKELC